MRRFSNGSRNAQHTFRSAVLAAMLAACGGDEPSGGEPDSSVSNDAGDAGLLTPVMVTARVNGLAGTGLVLRTSAGEVVTVAADGTIAFSQPVDGLRADSIVVESQPVSPRQHCVATIDAAASVTIACTTDSFKVGGTVVGLAGSGLVLKSASGERIEIKASGSFSFIETVTDLGSYAVEVASAPSAPAQSCIVQGGSGRVEGGDVTSVQVTCSTLAFTVGGTVSGLLGSGLQLALNGGPPLDITADGQFTFPGTVSDATPITVSVRTQPGAPQQTCVVNGGSTKLTGQAVASVSVVCGALGKLRISEVSSCYYTNASCWIEVYNAGTATEDLSFYTLRSTGVRSEPYVYDIAHSFALPSLAIPAGGYALLRGATDTALPSGLASVVVEDEATGIVPWWQRFGFVELLTAGQTVDFVRFGQNSQQPVTGTFTGDSATALPAGEAQHGYSLARSPTQTDSNAAGDFALRAFATPGGPNDVTSDVDLDADGIPDQSEQSGGRFAGLDLYKMGARTGKRDLFVEVDRMASSDAAVVPQRAALDRVVAAFAAQNIALHFDVGSLFAPSFDPAAYNLGGGDVVKFAPAIAMGKVAGNFADLYAYKAAHMGPERRAVFHYMLFAWSQEEDGGSGPSGVGERPGNDMVITLGGVGLTTSSTVGRNTTANYQAATLMHEIGHNLNLRHGGGDDVNYKPNYLSVMNYLYSPYGLPTVGMQEGDRYYLFSKCKLYSGQSNWASGDPASFRVDFSSGTSEDIVESTVDESDGLGASASIPVDYDCDGNASESYASDLNKDSKLTVLKDYDDWSEIEFAFQRSNAGNESGVGSTRPNTVSTRDDLLTDDVQSVDPEPCPTVNVVNVSL